MKKIALILPLLFSFILGFGQVTLDSKLIEYYDSGSSTYSNNDKSEYQYDENGNLLETIESYWDGFDWQIYWKTTYGYDSNNNRINETHASWNEGWDDEFRDNYTFDGSDLLTAFVGQNFNGSQWVNDFRIDITYVNGKITGYTGSDWSGIWDESSRGVINYNSSILNDILYQEKNGSNWVNIERETYTINGGTGKIEEQLIEDWNDPNWDNGAKFSYMLDGNGNRTSYIDEYYNGSTWVLNYSESNTFDNTTLMSTIHHPFNGINYDLGLEDFPYYHKIISMLEYQSDGTTINYRTTYSYSDDTASVHNYNQFELAVYPNPTADYLHLSIANFNSSASLEIFDLLGKKVNSFTLKSKSSRVDISSLSKGIYFLKIHSNGKVATKKVVKK